MKRLIVILAVLVPFLDTGASLAFAGDNNNHLVAFSSDANLRIDAPGDSATLHLDTNRPLGVNSAEEAVADQVVVVWGYAVNRQVSIDLQCRQSALTESDDKGVDDALDMENFTQNFLLGLSYKF